MTDGVRVRGAATAEEVAAVLAVLARTNAANEPASAPAGEGYARWRSLRLRSLRDPRERDRPT